MVNNSYPAWLWRLHFAIEAVAQSCVSWDHHPEGGQSIQDSMQRLFGGWNVTKTMQNSYAAVSMMYLSNEKWIRCYICLCNYQSSNCRELQQGNVPQENHCPDPIFRIPCRSSEGWVFIHLPLNPAKTLIFWVFYGWNEGFICICHHLSIIWSVFMGVNDSKFAYIRKDCKQIYDDIWYVHMIM